MRCELRLCYLVYMSFVYLLSSNRITSRILTGAIVRIMSALILFVNLFFLSLCLCLSLAFCHVHFFLIPLYPNALPRVRLSNV
jgi:hypothetical protein